MQDHDETVSNTSTNPCFTQLLASACRAASSSREGWCGWYGYAPRPAGERTRTAR